MDIISAIVGVVTGVITGIFSGMVTFRYGQYSDCKANLLELIWSLETGIELKDKEQWLIEQYYDFKSSKGIYHIAGHLESLGHSHAAKIVRELCQEIAHLEVKSFGGKVNLEDFRLAHQKLMDQAASISFSWSALLAFRTYRSGHYPPYSGWLQK